MCIFAKLHNPFGVKKVVARSRLKEHWIFSTPSRRPRFRTRRPRSGRCARTAAFSGALVCLLFLLPTFALQVPEPYHDGRKKELEYPGPGRELKAPEGLSEVRIAYFGPHDPTHPDGGDPWLAASLAIEELNQEGGFRGLPFRLLATWAQSPWGSGVSQLTRLVYSENVWAIIGGIDGPSTHLAEQVVAKARLPLLNPFSTDKSVGYAFVPWLFSLVPGDQLVAPALCDELLKAGPGTPYVLLSATDHDSQLAQREYQKYLSGRGYTPLYHLQFQPGSSQFTEQFARIRGQRFGKLLIVAGARDSAVLIEALRQAGFDQPVFGSPTLGRTAFRQAGRLAEDTVFPLMCADSPALEAFRSSFRLSHGRTPDYAAALTYDSVKLLGAAVRKAGLNRALIRDALRELSGWRGVCGPVEWDAVGQNKDPVTPATFPNDEIITSTTR